MKKIMCIKEKKKRRLLNLLLTAAMVFITIPAFGTAAFAGGDTPPAGIVNDCLTFCSEESFSISAVKCWAGNIWYSTDNSNWTEWDGSTPAVAAQQGGIGDYYLYFAGKGNSVVSSGRNWNISATKGVACSGKITTLLDCDNPDTCSMGDYAFKKMFYGCTALTQAPSLPSENLTIQCYAIMFEGCTNLETAPELRAMQLNEYCYARMFFGCTSLTAAPALPATKMEVGCYSDMFWNCINLITTPVLPAKIMANQCYSSMFEGCTSLTTAPVLPAEKLAPFCYAGMFHGCTNLKAIPELPAETLEKQCYFLMFKDCTSLTTPPELPATTLAESCYKGMFRGCTGLRIYYNSEDVHSHPYSVPSEKGGTDATDALLDMFTDTGGDSIGTPEINRDYYLITPLKVTYDANGGSGSMSVSEYDSDTYYPELKANITIQSNEFTKSGYRFTGWNTEPNGSGIFYAPGMEITITEHLNLYAQWASNDDDVYYMLTYETNGGTTYNQERYLEGITISLTKTPTKSGMVFDGWYEDEDLTRRITEVKMDQDRTVYAAWKENGGGGGGGGTPTPTPEPETVEPEFLLDAENHGAYMIGYEDGKFYPNQAITRAEMAAMVFRLMKSDSAELYLKTDCSYTDMTEKSWYKTYVSTLSNAGIIEGYENNTFRPSRTITRAEFATMIDRFFIEEEDEAEYTNKFSDVSESYWAGDAIFRCTERSLLEGYEDGTFRPGQPITRAEATAIMNRLLQRNPASAEALLPEMIQWPDNQDTELWYYIDVQEASNSHEYVRNEDGTETWTALKSVYDWKQYE